MQADRYNGWRFRAHLDRIRVRLDLQAPTQARHLRSALPEAWHGDETGLAPFAQPVNSQGTAWQFWIQDPPNAATTAAHLRRLAELHRLAAPPLITGVEVAFDAFPELPGLDLVDMAEHLYRGLAAPVSVNRRLLPKTGSGDKPTNAQLNRDDNRRCLAAGCSIFIGNADDNRTQRVYVKDGAHARMENTYTDQAVPFTSLHEWQSYAFWRLSKDFRWVCFRDDPGLGTDPPAPPADPGFSPALLLPQLRQRAAVLDKTTGLSTGNRNADRRKRKAGTRADATLQEEARKALRRLTTQQGQGPPVTEIWTKSTS